MQINKVGNIIHYDFKKPENKIAKEKNQKDALKSDNNETELPKAAYASAPIDIVKHINSKKDEKLNDEVQQVKAFFDEKGFNLQDKLVKRAIKKYYADAKEMANVPNMAYKFTMDLEQKLQKIDFSSVNKIKNFYGDGNPLNSKASVKKALLGADDEDGTEALSGLPDDVSYEVMTPIAKSYFDILTKELPEYRIGFFMEGDLDDNLEGANVCSYVEISKGDETIRFQRPDIFISSMASKTISPETYYVKLIDGEREYQFTRSDDIIEKFNFVTETEEGVISLDCFDDKNKPWLFLDDEGAFGAVFYVINEYTLAKVQSRKAPTEITPDELGLYSKDILNKIQEAIGNDENLAEFANKGYGEEFFLSAVRNGALNYNVLEAMDYVMQYRQNYAYDLVEQGFLNNCINLIEEEDNTFNYDILYILCELLYKARSTTENQDEAFYKALTFIKNNQTKENFKVLEKISEADYVAMEDVEPLVNILELFSDKEYEKANKALDTFAAQKCKSWGSLENAKKVYNNLFVRVRV